MSVKLIPILFSTPMVQAILAGNKTQTRRVVKPQPIVGEKQTVYEVAKNDWWVGELHNFPMTTHFSGHSSSRFSCPYGQLGDILWVRETVFAYGHYYRENEKSKIEFKDITLDPVLGVGKYEYMDSVPNIVHKRKTAGAIGYYKKPSIHMPKAACRIFLKITNVRVERLQNISEQDAIAEGISLSGGYFLDYGNKKHCMQSPVKSYYTLWESINGSGSWEANPWVWVIEFEHCEKPLHL